MNPSNIFRRLALPGALAAGVVGVALTNVAPASADAFADSAVVIDTATSVQSLTAVQGLAGVSTRVVAGTEYAGGGSTFVSGSQLTQVPPFFSQNESYLSSSQFSLVGGNGVQYQGAGALSALFGTDTTVLNGAFGGASSLGGF